MLDRWLAHHLAEVLIETDRAVGPAKAASESQAVDLILKLWVHRRALPEPVDPLGGCRKAVEMLGRLVPEANPWAHSRQPDSRDRLLREMFQILSKIVLAGLYLTQISRSRPTTAEESRLLDEEELYLKTAFEQWMPLFPRMQAKPETQTEFVGTDAPEGAKQDGKSERLDDSDSHDPAPDEQMASVDAQLHAGIASNLEHMQADLAKLLIRWRESQPCNRDGDGENTIGLDGGRAGTMTDSRGESGSGDIVPKKPGAETAGADSLRPDGGHSFWSSLTLTELAEAQGVAPVEDLESMVALWPSDDDPDEVLAHVLAERRARRRVVRSDEPR